MSNKIKKFTPEQLKKKQELQQQEELEGFLKGRPSRQEVAQYCNGLLEQHYMPEIMRQIRLSQQGMQLGLMAMQAILINKGICTGEEIEKVTREYVDKFNEERAKEEKEQAEAEENLSKLSQEEIENLQ